MVSDMLRSQGNSPQEQLLDAFRIELFEDVSAMTARRKARTQRPAKNGKNEVEAPVTNGASRNTPRKTPARSRKTVPEVHDPPKRKAKTPPEKTSKQKSTPKAENKAKANGALKPSKPDPAKPKSSTGRGKKVPKTHADKAGSQSEEAEEASGRPSSTSSTMSSSTTLTSRTSSTTSSSKKSAVQKQKDQKDPKDSGQSKKRKAPSSKDSSETEEKTEKRRKRPISSESEDYPVSSRIVERHVDVVVEELKTKPKEFIRVQPRPKKLAGSTLAATPKVSKVPKIQAKPKPKATVKDEKSLKKRRYVVDQDDEESSGEEEEEPPKARALAKQAAAKDTSSEEEEAQVPTAKPAAGAEAAEKERDLHAEVAKRQEDTSGWVVCSQCTGNQNKE
eukprot:symbB.v1.2.026648.t1/scaffold2679.1/size73150/5